MVRDKIGEMMKNIEEALRIGAIFEQYGVNFIKVNYNITDETKSGHIRPVTLKDIKQKGIDTEKIIKKHSLDPDFPIGKYMQTMSEMNRGRRTNRMTNEQLMEAEDLGFIQPRYSSIDGLIDICKKLTNEGVNVSKIKISKIVDKKPCLITLKEIEIKDFDINEFIKKYNLEEDFPFGQTVHNLRSMYTGTTSSELSDSQLLAAEKYKIVSRVSKARELLDIAELLYKNGVILQKLRTKVPIEKDKYRFLTLGELRYAGVDIQSIIKENDLDPEYPYGNRESMVKKGYTSYRKNKAKTYCGYTLTKKEAEDVERLELVKPGVVAKYNARDLAKASYEARASICDDVDRQIKEINEKEQKNKGKYYDDL